MSVTYDKPIIKGVGYKRGPYEKHDRKYRPMHEIVKELKLKGSMAQFLDSAIDHVGKVIDNSTFKDLIALPVFFFGSYAVYSLLLQAKGLYTTLTSYTEGVFPGGVDYFVKSWGLMMQGKVGELPNYFEQQKKEEIAKNEKIKLEDGKEYSVIESIDWVILGEAMIITFIAINTRMTDITGLVSKIGGIL